MKINSHKSSRCNQNVSDDIKFLLSTNINLISIKVELKLKLIFQIIHENRLRVENCSKVVQLKDFLDLISCELRRQIC